MTALRISGEEDDFIRSPIPVRTAIKEVLLKDDNRK